MVSSKGADDLLVDSDRVFVLHLLMPLIEGGCALCSAAKDLEGGGHQKRWVLFDEPVPARMKLIDADSQKVHILFIGVKRQAVVRSANEHQEQVEQKARSG